MSTFVQRGKRALAGVATMALLASGLTLMAGGAANAASAVTVTGNDIRHSEATYLGWHEGYSNADRHYFVDGSGLHFATGDVNSQILNGTAEVPTNADGLLAAISGASVTVVSGSPTFQIPLFFGSGITQTYTTLRSNAMAPGAMNTWTGTDLWASSKQVGAIPAHELRPLQEFIDAMRGQALRLLGFGVQANTAAVVSSISYGGEKYVFAPFTVAAPTVADEIVREVDLKNSENPTTYTSWHEGKGVDSSTVKGDGLHMGTPGASTVIKGTTVYTAPASHRVTQAQLQELISKASVVSASGKITFQVPVHFGAGLNYYTTLRTTSLEAGSHTFALTDQWATSRAFGQYTGHNGNNFEDALGDMLDELFSNAVSGGEVWVAGYGVQADAPAVVKSLVWDGQRTVFKQPVTSECTPTSTVNATNRDSKSWDFTQTRLQGHQEFTANGLHVWTEGAPPASGPDQRKAAGYFAITPIPLSAVGSEPLLNMTGVSGLAPSLQLGISLDGDGGWDGYIVNEGDLYGHGNWWTNKSNFGVSAGGGYPSMGTLNDYLIANPDAKVISIGYSMGSGAPGEATISSIVAGCTEYTFKKDVGYETPAAETFVDDTHIVPKADVAGWGDGYGHTPRSYFTDAAGAHIGQGYRTQLIYNMASPVDNIDLQSMLADASVEVVDGQVTYQVAIYYGTAGTFTTLRSAALPVGTHHFSATDRWTSSRALVANADNAAWSGSTTAHLADILAFVKAQGSVKLLGVGVQAEHPATVQSIVFNGAKTTFVPTEQISPNNEVPVTEGEIEESETSANYTKWHEGYTNATKSFSVDAGGLKFGSPSKSQILKGLDTPVSVDSLYSLLTSQAGANVASGAVTYQVAVTFDSGWSTLRSGALAQGENTFSLSSEWMSSKPIGTAILANTGYPLGVILDALKVAGNAKAIGFGVQTMAAANVTTITWGNTRYTFVPTMTAALPTISGNAMVGETLTADAKGASWTPATGVTFAYEWKADGVPVGTNSATYVLTEADLGKTISVKVTGEATGYGSASGTSLGVGPVESNTIEIIRLAGDDRYKTAVEISKAGWDSSVVAFIASGASFADALSAAPMAGAWGRPLLLTEPGKLTKATADELLRLGVEKVFIVGGTGAVSATVEAQLNALSTIVDPAERISGVDRYATSRAIAEFGFPVDARTAYIADGSNFPDALAAGPSAANFPGNDPNYPGGPVILVPGKASSLDVATMDELEILGIENIKIAGGTGVVSAGIEAQLKAKFGASKVTRNAGENRYETAVMINLDSWTSSQSVFIATGLGFADALAGAALAGAMNAPLFVSTASCIPNDVLAAISSLRPRQVVLLGGTGVLGPAVETLTACQ